MLHHLNSHQIVARCLNKLIRTTYFGSASPVKLALFRADCMSRWICKYSLYTREHTHDRYGTFVYGFIVNNTVCAIFVKTTTKYFVWSSKYYKKNNIFFIKYYEIKYYNIYKFFINIINL